MGRMYCLLIHHIHFIVMEKLDSHHNKYLLQRQKIDKWESNDYDLDKTSEKYINDEFKFILDETHHVCHREVINNLIGLIKNLSKTKPYYIFFPNGATEMFKVGSEHFFVMECFSAIKMLNIVGVVSDERDYYRLSDGSNILFIDDCIYTGNHINSLIGYLVSLSCAENISLEFLTYARSEEFGVESIPYDDFKISITSCILLEPIMDKFIRFITKAERSRSKDMKRNIMTEGHKNIDIIHKQLGGPGKGEIIPAIYFDHKMHPTIEPLFKMHTKCVPSRMPIEIIMKQLII